MHRSAPTKSNETYRKQNFPPVILFCKNETLFFSLSALSIYQRRDRIDESRQKKKNEMHIKPQVLREYLLYVSTDDSILSI